MQRNLFITNNKTKSPLFNTLETFYSEWAEQLRDQADAEARTIRLARERICGGPFRFIPLPAA